MHWGLPWVGSDDHVPVSSGTIEMKGLEDGHQQLTQNLPNVVARPGTDQVRPATHARQAPRWRRWRDRASGDGKAVAMKMG